MNQSFLILIRCITVICLSLVLPAVDSYAAVGLDLNLKLPPSRLTRLEIQTPDRIGFSISQEPRAYFESVLLKRTLFFNYNEASQLLVFDEGTGKYTGYAIPLAVSPKETQAREFDKESQLLFQKGAKEAAQRRALGSSGGLLEFEIPIRTPKMIKSIIGEGGAGLKVNGYRKISFAGRSQWNDGEQVTAGQSKFPSLQMEQISSFTISGTIGSKIFVDVNQDSKRQESLANRIQLRYKGDEDDVIKTIELGNTNLSLPSTRFSGYSQRIQGLFGVKTTAEVGGLRLTGIASQEKSSNKSASFSAGAETASRIIRDWNYLDNLYFFLTRQDTLGLSEADMLPARRENGVDLPADSLINWKIYIFYENNSANSDIPKKYAKMYVDPLNPGKYTNESFAGTVIQYGADRRTSQSSEDFYFVHRTSQYVLFDQRIPDNKAVGVYYSYVRTNLDGTKDTNTVGSLGSTDSDTLTLKLIRADNPRPSFVTWKYVWRNVYDVGRVDDPDGFNAVIYRGDAQSSADKDPADLYHQNGQDFITILGLDNNTDGKVDAYNTQLLDRNRGHLRFPGLRPFDDPLLTDRVSAIYDTTSSEDRTRASKYYIEVNSSSRQSEFKLGNYDIVPESENVTLNGRTLTRDVDYRILYESGSITFMNEEALSAGADVKIDYEFAPLISSQKKTLLGARGDYEFSKNFRVGAMALFKSEKETDRKPKLGEEQAKFLNLDVDAAYSFDSYGLTRFVNLLPFYESKSPSRISIQGEIGQSLPNPNVKGEASIDDFEGSKERYSVGVTRVSWVPMSPPAHLDTLLIRRGNLIWYNPYDQVPVTDIYDRDVKAGENRTNILVMRFAPKPNLTDDKSGSFAGIMRAFSRSSYDQSKSRFLELRMRGRVGKLHIDLGEISEDVNGNSTIETEDIIIPNQIAEEAEDVGIDLISDEKELAMCAAGTAPPSYDCTSTTDPAGDDWYYNNDEKDNYNRINGTEKNRDDLQRVNRPDTEDLDGNSAPDTRNNYFSWTLDLANNPFRVEGTERNDWYTVRIPFQDGSLCDSIGAPLRSNIKVIRLWVDGVTVDTAFVEVAEIELSKNAWESTGLLPLEADHNPETRFEVAVINTEEDSIYTPPPGVEGFYDKTTQLREREQALRLDFEKLAPGDSGMAEKIPFKSQDLSGYNKLEMWIHGDSARSNLLFFYRFGPDNKNYYEYRTTLGPGWDKNHSVNIVFDELTQIKLRLNELKAENPDTNEYAEGKFRILGNPSITRIKYYAMGLTNTDSTETGSELSGDIWIDEMRATEVRRDKGLAGFISGSVTLADLGSFTASYSRQDEFFRTLTQADRRDLGSGSKNTSYAYSVNLYLEKLLPPNHGASLPFSYNWSRSELSPRLITGSDILVPDELKDEQSSISTNYGFSISERWNKQSKNPLYSVLLNKFSSSFSWRKTESKNPTVPVNESEGYNAKGRYSIVSPLQHGLKIFSWLGGIPLMPKRVTGTEFNPLPNRLNFDADVNRTTDNRINNFGVTTFRYSRTLRGSFDTGANPLSGWELGYRFTTDRDISDENLVKLSLNPKTAKLGRERNYNEAFTANYSPNVLPFITGTKLGFSSSHDESFNQDQATAQISDVRRIQDARSFSAGSTLNIQKLLGQNKKAAPKRPAAPPKPPVKNPSLDSLRRNKIDSDSLKSGSKKETPKEPGTPVYGYGLRFIRLFTDQIDPVAVSFKWDERIALDGFDERPSLLYRLGLTSVLTAHRVAINSNTNQVDQYSKGRTYSARSGVRLPMGFSVGTNWAYSIQGGSNRQTRDESRTWPDLGFRFGQLDWLLFPRLFTKTLTLDSKYAERKNWQFNSSTEQKRSEIHTTDYSPLISASFDLRYLPLMRWTFSMSKSISEKMNFRDGINEDGSLSAHTKDITTGFTAKTSYSFRGGSNLWLPLFGRVKIQSNLSLDLDISKRRTRSQNHVIAKDSTGSPYIRIDETANRSELTIQPAATYNFSTNIKGGLRARWTDSKDIKSGGRHVRELEFWVEIRF